MAKRIAMRAEWTANGIKYVMSIGNMLFQIYSEIKGITFRFLYASYWFFWHFLVHTRLSTASCASWKLPTLSSFHWVIAQPCCTDDWRHQGSHSCTTSSGVHECASVKAQPTRCPWTRLRPGSCTSSPYSWRARGLCLSTEHTQLHMRRQGTQAHCKAKY